MRRYSILHALPLAFFSRDLYRDVALHWRGAGLMYLLLLVALTTALFLTPIQVGIWQWARGGASTIVNQIPTIRIRHGVVEVDRPTPLFITDSKGTALAIIDTSGSITSLEGSDALLLLTRDHMYVRKSGAETRVFDLSRVEDFRMDRVRAAGWLRVLVTWLAVLLAPFVLVGLYAFRLIQQLIGSLIGLLVARVSNVKLDFQARMRLASVALTPALIIEVALSFVKAKPPFWGLLWTAIAIGYLVIAIRSSRDGPAHAPGAEAHAPNSPE